MSQEYVDNYTKSQKATLPTLSFSTITKKEYETGRELENITEQKLQKIADAVCCEFAVPTIPISFKGIQPYSCNGKRLTKKVMGAFRKTNFGNSSIQVYKYTAKQNKKYAPKSAISTLVHELCHYFDYRVCGLKKSIHSKGFYGRIRQLTDMLS
jgi:hypothetical protein